MRKPPLLSPGWVAPLSDSNEKTVCAKCFSGEGGKWAIGKPPNYYVSCAHCFLRDTPWANENSGKIRDLALDVEKEMGESVVDNSGLVLRGHADRILYSIVVVSRLKNSRSGRAKEAQ